MRLFQTSSCGQQQKRQHERQKDRYTEDGTSNEDGPIHFQRQSDHFVQQFADCFVDDNRENKDDERNSGNDCHIYYFHFGKSGGTGLEERMALFAPPRRNSCCNKGLLERFRSAPENYCKLKFSSYQLSTENFLHTIVPTCMDINKDSNNTDNSHDNENWGRRRTRHQGKKSIVLISYREPIQRTLSYIHQMCNKHYDVRPEKTQQVCQRCSYDDDTRYWDDLVDRMNNAYSALRGLVNYHHPDITVLTIDLLDFTPFYQRLHEALLQRKLYAKYHNLNKNKNNNLTDHILNNDHGSGDDGDDGGELVFAFNATTKSNPENNNKYCNFGMKSDMFRRLRPSIALYRNWTSS
eukprot:CAMPEP_0178517232 /NCGR_PEP_ID=MMETSP0696-20121128/25575_1 /TAXON_ID=265572 /ORGANISM="Extubocellulus spinifer, Strain CCMP396" /LENGTH=350 /DNA_ID=CAMNT_0020147637 /DNA_START=142 /DNA_END=1194 /DNA_ORIENTATION=+